MDHIHPDHPHGHSHGHAHHHGHGHGHSHEHGHGHDDSEFYLEQLLTITICGGFGIVGVLMYQFGMLNELLAPEFHRWVALGGAVLLVLTAIRAISLWSTATPSGNREHQHAPHDQNHVHGPDCDHDHDHDHDQNHVHGPDCDHDHDHSHTHAHDHSHTHDHAHGHTHAHGDHEHGNIFWRIVVLAFPLVLFFLGLPNESFIRNFKLHKLGGDTHLGDIGDVQATGSTIPMDFNQLALVAMDPGKRTYLTGNATSIVGQFKPVADREFTLFKMKMTCCAADEIPLKARIIADFVPSNVKPFDWIKVTGIMQFAEIPGKNEFLPVLRVKEQQGIQAAKPER
ncbi:MAG: hypothetical protein LC104_22055 [Bacteroidales bacterium]|nr:hypothetical protein [Bacteroidales bacterium]